MRHLKAYLFSVLTRQLFLLAFYIGEARVIIIVLVVLVTASTTDAGAVVVGFPEATGSAAGAGPPTFACGVAGVNRAASSGI
jgi:hypothetical protein